MRYAVKGGEAGLETLLASEVGPDAEFPRRAWQLAEADIVPDLHWCWDVELTLREGISVLTCHYVAEALGAGTLGHLGRRDVQLLQLCTAVYSCVQLLHPV